MGTSEVQQRAGRHDAVGIDRQMAQVIVALDVLHVHRLGHTRPRI